MYWKTATVLTLVATSSLSAQRHDRHRHDRIDIPRIEVNIPPIRVDVPEVRVAVPAINIDIPAMRFDFSHIGAGIEHAVREAVGAIEHMDWDFDIDVDHDVQASEMTRVNRLRREWRNAVRKAETTGDWEQADALARQLTRAADRLKK